MILPKPVQDYYECQYLCKNIPNINLLDGTTTIKKKHRDDCQYNKNHKNFWAALQGLIPIEERDERANRSDSDSGSTPGQLPED